MAEQRSFGKTRDGREATLYTLRNSKGMKADVTDYGAILVNLSVPGKDGQTQDVVLGFDKAEDYFRNPSFFGATIAPSANRIAGAKFVIDGKVYRLDVNDGVNNLHSHVEKGYHKRLWTAETAPDSVTFSLEDEDGSMGFPGNKKFQVTYSLDEENALTLTCHARSDKKTLINPTNHTYFNLDGHKGGQKAFEEGSSGASIEDHELCLVASHYTPVVEGAIPTGEIAPVAGTPMDFMKPKRIGLEIEENFEQLKLTGGYDHNWVIDGYDGTLRHCATLKAPKSGRKMEVYTTLPGIQFYAGNAIASQPGKDGAVYQARSGLCLETQFYPNSINQPGFPSCVFGAGEDYDSVTVYKFL
ncbi:MAG: galactose mutarotase [Clostridium sp.]|jgi:aldose 1-epimerase|nr:galactose mutarotase [Clostridium sp.]